MSTVDTTVTVEVVPATPTLVVGKSAKLYRDSINETVHLFGRLHTNKGKERAGITHVLIQGRKPSESLSNQLQAEGFGLSIEPDRVLSGQSLLLALQGQAVKGWVMPNRLRKSILSAIAKNGGVDMSTD
jgi:hypothetical protein